MAESTLPETSRWYVGGGDGMLEKRKKEKNAAEQFEKDDIC